MQRAQGPISQSRARHRYCVCFVHCGCVLLSSNRRKRVCGAKQQRYIFKFESNTHTKAQATRWLHYYIYIYIDIGLLLVRSFSDASRSCARCPLSPNGDDHPSLSCHLSSRTTPIVVATAINTRARALTAASSPIPGSCHASAAPDRGGAAALLPSVGTPFQVNEWFTGITASILGTQFPKAVVVPAAQRHCGSVRMHGQCSAENCFSPLPSPRAPG